MSQQIVSRSSSTATHRLMALCYFHNTSSGQLSTDYRGRVTNASKCRSDATTSPSPFNNLTDELRSEFEFIIAQWIWQVCPVILFLFGTFGNTAILLTLRHLRLGRNSMHIYLRALALSDQCVLYTGLLRRWLVWTFKIDLRTQHVALCKIHTWLVYVSLSVSTWLLVVMTLERTCSTCLPHRVVACCTTGRALCFIVFIVVFYGVLHAHFLVGLALRVDETKGVVKCNSVTEEYHYFVHEIWPLLDLCLLSLLPFLCLTVGNAIIVWKTFVSLRTVEELSTSFRHNAQRRRKRASSMTIILLSLSALFLLTTSPVCVYNLWERGGSATEYVKSSKDEARLELIWAVINIAMYCNNTFNFYLYCLTGKKFRLEMLRQLTRHRSDSHSNIVSAPSMHRFVVLNQANRIRAQSFREATPLRVSSVRFNGPEDV